MRVAYVSSSTDIVYSGTYLLGLRRLGYKLRFTSAFRAPRFGTAMVVDERRIVLCANDRADVDAELLDWADVYGKVNPAVDDARVIPLGPNFGIRCFSRGKSLALAIAHPKLGRGLLSAVRNTLPESQYDPGASDPRYLFHASTIWVPKGDPTTEFRTNFIRTARGLSGVRFEGGFAPGTDGRAVPGFEALSMPRRVRRREYLARTKASGAVFSTPALRKCHGWKLGEFLALGKAIISTPHIRALPAPLEHGTHVNYVDGSMEQIGLALESILSTPGYRRHLEESARSYYDRYLSPEAVMRRMLECRVTRDAARSADSNRQSMGARPAGAASPDSAADSDTSSKRLGARSVRPDSAAQ